MKDLIYFNSLLPYKLRLPKQDYSVSDLKSISDPWLISSLLAADQIAELALLEMFGITAEEKDIKKITGNLDISRAAVFMGYFVLSSDC